MFTDFIFCARFCCFVFECGVVVAHRMLWSTFALQFSDGPLIKRFRLRISLHFYKQWKVFTRSGAGHGDKVYLCEAKWPAVCRSAGARVTQTFGSQIVASLRIHCGCTWLRGQGLSMIHIKYSFSLGISLWRQKVILLGLFAWKEFVFSEEKVRIQNALTGGEHCSDFPKIIASLRESFSSAAFYFLRQEWRERDGASAAW